MANRKRNPKLNQAYSFWRLAAKARKNGQGKLADHYQRIGDQRHASWQRDQEYIASLGR